MSIGPSSYAAGAFDYTPASGAILSFARDPKTGAYLKDANGNFIPAARVQTLAQATSAAAAGLVGAAPASLSLGGVTRGELVAAAFAAAVAAGAWWWTRRAA